MRRSFVVGNWKMNKTLAEARTLVSGIAERLPASTAVDVGIAPSAILLMPMCKALAGAPMQLGAQNVFHESSGAYTGELSPPMLVDAGCGFVIIGHSERRQIFGEGGELLQRKVAASIAAGLDVIYCIGETLEQREQAQTHRVLEDQLSGVLVAGLDWGKITLAYEPVWAIGTGRNATADQAQETQQFVRGWIGETYGPLAAAHMRIQYGGSVKPDNAAELMSMPDVDGALVGGASLKADDFVAIIEAAERSTVQS